MQDFLEYMQSLQAWQNWGKMQPMQRLLYTMSGFSAQGQLQRSPSRIFSYAKQHHVLKHSWLSRFQQGDIEPEMLRLWVQQRYLISWCFPNWLAGVFAKLPSSETRIPLLENLYEEHGLVEGSTHHSKPHPQMWQQLFEELGVVEPGTPLPRPRSSQELLAGTQMYLQIFTEACFKCPVAVGLGAMAFVESILPFENVLILHGLQKLNISRAGQEFFAVHCACDEAHATEIIGVIEQVTDTPTALAQAWQGVEMAALARKAFYDSLLALATPQKVISGNAAYQSIPTFLEQVA